jgi:2-phosphoglycerate kinase
MIRAGDPREHANATVEPGIGRFCQSSSTSFDVSAGAIPSRLKPIVLLGGAPGTGKSTVASILSCRLDLDHRLGTGFIREILQAESSREREPALFRLTFESDNPIEHVLWQARRLRAAVVACVDRARREGTSLIVEGSHLIPTIYSDLHVDVFAVLVAPQDEEHRRRIHGHRHTRRQVELDGVRRIQEIDLMYRREAKRAGVPLLSTEAPVDRVVEALVQLLHLH